jgi:hypothetical protein
MHKNATKCNKTLSKWCKNKNGSSKIIDTFGTYQGGAAAPLLDALITKAPVQEEAVVVKSPEVPPKKSIHVRASKRLKKTVAVGTSLEAHRPATSSDDVSIASCSRFFHYLIFSLIISFLQNLMQKFISLGTECVGFLETAWALQGMPFLCYVLYLFSCLSSVSHSLSFSCFGL